MNVLTTLKTLYLASTMVRMEVPF